ncbi:hypothetical protein HDU82_000738 [Entophlyctis luteolus]|nr:hypothetical protein HDU82_000738 [Entophlyctis luteolus]
MLSSTASLDIAALHCACRRKVADAMHAVGVVSGLIFLEGGRSEFRHDTDHEHLFRQESYFHYLFGINEPGLYGILDLRNDSATVFVPRSSVDDAVWSGAPLSPADYQSKFGLDRVMFVDELPAVVHGLMAETPDSKLYVLAGVNTDSRRAFATPDVYSILSPFSPSKDKVDSTLLYPLVVECRTTKTPLELQLLRQVNKVSSDAHIEVMKRVRPGMVEVQLEALFVAHTAFEGGCRYTAYTCICGSGANGAILHYGHAGAPNSKVIKDGDMCLLDMGAEYHCYTSDITCSFPANGKFTEKQKGIYSAVLRALVAVRESIRAGVEWVDMHLLAEKEIVNTLVEIGIIFLHDKTVSDICEMQIGALFFPHGLGHLMGLDTHDCGGYPHGKTRFDRAGLKALRMNRVLKAGMVLTNEPGCYFIPALLLPAFSDSVMGRYLNQDLIEREYLDFGGVRLEEDLIVTDNGCENMTQVPRTVDEIEAIMSRK